MILYRRLKLLIDKLKKAEEPKAKTVSGSRCSETDTEADHLSDGGSDDFCFPNSISRSKTVTTGEEFTDDTPLMSLYQSIKGSSRKNTDHMDSLTNSTKQAQLSPENLTNLTSNHRANNRKRVLVISDDDDDEECSSREDHNCLKEDFPTSDASMFSLLFSKPKIPFYQNHLLNCTYLIAVINKASPRKVQVKKSPLVCMFVSVTQKLSACSCFAFWDGRLSLSMDPNIQ